MTIDKSYWENKISIISTNVEKEKLLEQKSKLKELFDSILHKSMSQY